MYTVVLSERNNSPVGAVHKDIDIGDRDLGFNSRLVKLSTASPKARHRCDVFLKQCCQALSCGDDSRHYCSYTLRRNTTSIMKIDFFYLQNSKYFDENKLIWAEQDLIGEIENHLCCIICSSLIVYEIACRPILRINSKDSAPPICKVIEIMKSILF